MLREIDNMRNKEMRERERERGGGYSAVPRFRVTPNRGLNPIYIKQSQTTFEKTFLALGWPPSIKLLVINPRVQVRPRLK